MESQSDFGPVVEWEIVKVRTEKAEKVQDKIVTEIPLTILANEIEVATLLCSPCYLKELSYGFLYASGLIRNAEEIQSYVLDNVKWVAHLELAKTPDPTILHSRLYTSGCGKGILFSNMADISFRRAIASNLSISQEQVFAISRWLQHSSDLFLKTGGVHTAALSDKGQIPWVSLDDIGRHNAVDKVIGRGLLSGISFADMVLVSSGRISSEILHKARKCAIPIVISRGAPTHQTILLAKEMGITVIGFARGSHFSIYSHAERILL